MKIYEFLLLTIAVVCVSILTFMAADKGLSGYEQYECQKWQAEARQYQGYFLTGWQGAQCAHYNIKIDAPVQ